MPTMLPPLLPNNVATANGTEEAIFAPILTEDDLASYYDDPDRPQFCASGSTFREMERYETIGFHLEVGYLMAIGIFGFCGNLVAIPVLLSKPISNLFNRKDCFEGISIDLLYLLVKG